MAYEFSSCRIAGSGNAVFPEKIIIERDCVIYRKARVIGYKEVKIPFRNLASVQIDMHVLFADIVLETNGGDIIVAHGFSRFDAKEIADLLPK
jgi:hypothetical protein